jgi:hypothetical protein
MTRVELEDWQEAKRIAGTENLRHEYFITDRTEPVVWAWYVYLCAQLTRPWFEERRQEALTQFRRALGRDEARRMSLVSRAVGKCTSGAEQNCTRERRSVSVKVSWSV